jgi:ubiquinone/menaquinone biosynthesis C-methylase UbiE
LHEHRDRVAFVPAAFLQPGWVEAVPTRGGFDAVVSSFSLSAAGEERKRAIFREIFALLQPEGVFINIEHVSSATRWTQLPVDDYLIDAIFGEEIQRSPHKTRAEVAHEYYERAARIGAAAAPLEVQCEWLREAGFESVECFLKMQELAVFGGQRGPAGGAVEAGEYR